MDNLDDSENNAKISDSAYSNSGSNSQSKRSHSSKSTHSGSHSSGSSGYGGQQSTSNSCKTLSQLPEKRTKDKDGKKKKQARTELVQIQTDVEFRLPDPTPIVEVEEEVQNASPPPDVDQTQIGVQRCLEVTKKVTDEHPDDCSTPQPTLHMLNNKPGQSDGFSCVISMHDGVVLYMSSSLSSAVGFSKDMWIGRSFIDFVHPLDHGTFASQITSGLAVPKEVNGMLDTVQSNGNAVSTIFCRIRRYRALGTAFNVKERTVSFMPFMLKLSFKNVHEDKRPLIYLVIQATPVYSAYKTPNEIVEDAIPFVMRHVASGNLEYIDKEAVPLLGYLPQDISSQDILKLYHPEDLPYVRHLYENIVKHGRIPRSKPYRLLAQNGDYVKLETEWSSFINPWSRKLEFVIGKHYVVEGPTNADVFLPPPVRNNNKISDEDKIEIEGIRESIVKVLNEVPTKPAELKLLMTKRCQNLASFMESLIEEEPKVDDELRLEIQENDNSYYERDSVMLGGISPHHDYTDSKSSTGTPLSYNQINYNINLKRYFDSHQEAFEEDGVNVTDMTLVPIKELSGECMSPMAPYSGSEEMTSAESANLTFVEDNTVSLPHEYQSIRLTESIMTKHNSEMEKIFVKNHRETRPSKKEEREKINKETKQKKRDHLVRCNASFVPTNSVKAEPQPRGLKRSSKQAEVEPGTHKQHCASLRQMRRRQPSDSAAQPSASSIPQPCTSTPQPGTSTTTQPWTSSTPQPSVSASTQVWSQNFVNGMNPFMSQHQMSLMSPITTVPGFVPMYYLPAPGPAMPCTSEMSSHDPTKYTAQVQFQAPPMQYMMFGQAVFGSPIVVSPINHQATFPRPPGIVQTQLTTTQNNLSLATRNYEEACKPGLLPLGKAQLAAWREEKRAADAAAAVSTLAVRSAAACRGSNNICSATNALDRSNEDVPESSVSRDSKTKSEEAVDRTDGESSYSSFYSSFFKTESGSAEDSDAKNKQNQRNSSGAPSIPGKHSLHNKQMQRRKKEPPWMEHVSVTSELIYKYQVLTKSLDEVLISDGKKLIGVEQPALVNDQLGQLYMELELEGVAARLTLEEGVTSSGSSSDDGHKLAMDALAKRARRKRKYSKLVMIYEEDAPMPSPEEEPEPEPSTSVA